MDFNLLVGGAAGQGMDTLATLLQRSLKRNGYQMYVHKDYMSRIRGGHNFIQIRFSNEPLTTHRRSLDLIIALDQRTLETHLPRLHSQGTALCDQRVEFDDERVMHFPVEAQAKEAGEKKSVPMVLAGLTLQWFGLDLEPAREFIRELFTQTDLQQINQKALDAGASLVQPQISLPEGRQEDCLLLSGNEAVALGAVAAGVTFYAAYPMTPSTGIMNNLAAWQNQVELVVEQAEDELAAMNMAIGASFAGIRSMTGTSGGGFSLMVEALGLAGMTETPLVVAEVQRPGPATGFPTRTEQGDLGFVIHASQGEIPRMVTALRNPGESFHQTARAFNLAEKYQIPVILMSDHYLSDSSVTLPAFDLDLVRIERHLARAETDQTDLPYQRYQFTPSGISPRIVPGKWKGQVVLADSDEHDEAGHITESAKIRTAMVDKRMGKMEWLRQEVEEPWQLGDPDPEVLLLAWGSVAGAVEETLNRWNRQKDQPSVGALIFGDLWPLPAKLLTELAGQARRLINVEQNHTGQLARLIRQETGISCDTSILKYDGRQIGPEEVWEALEKEVGSNG